MIGINNIMDFNNFNNFFQTIPLFKMDNLMEFYYRVYLNDNTDEFDDYIYLLDNKLLVFLSLDSNNFNQIKKIIINLIKQKLNKEIENNNPNYRLINNQYVFFPDVIDDDMVQCEFCGNIWDGNAQCDCFLY